MHVISQQLLAYAYNIICMAHFSCSLKCCLMDSMHSLYMPSEIDAATDHASDDDDNYYHLLQGVPHSDASGHF